MGCVSILAVATENLLDIDEYSSAVENVDNPTEPNNNSTTLWVRSCPCMPAFLLNETLREDSTWVTADQQLCLSCYNSTTILLLFSGDGWLSGRGFFKVWGTQSCSYLFSQASVLSKSPFYLSSMRGRKGKFLRSELHVKNMLITSRKSRLSPTTFFLCFFLKIVGTIWNIYFSFFRILGLRLIFRSNWAKALFPYQGLMRQNFWFYLCILHWIKLELYFTVVWQGIIHPANV